MSDLEAACQYAREAKTAVEDILGERIRNRIRWGAQNHPSVSPLAINGGDVACNLHGLPTERQAKDRCERMMAARRVTWTDILLEEFAEAVSAPNDIERRAELVQVAAVVVAWIECIDRRLANAVPAQKRGVAS